MLEDLLRPTTDLGAVLQVVVVLVVGAVGLVRTWDHPDRRLVVAGAVLLLVALMGLRAAH